MEDGAGTEAMLWEPLADGRVRCGLCAHRCTLAPGRRGICQVRENRDGRLYTLVYGRVIARHVDPIEKKPLYHFHPGSTAYSIATPGCNFRCQWCQNWEISQQVGTHHLVAGEAATPEQLVAAARQAGSRSIAYTYTEPTIYCEYALATARLARPAGLANVFVTNGYMTEQMLALVAPYLDAANVDLKAFRDETYRTYAGARLAPVLASLRQMRRLGIWVEVTTLVIPGINDDEAELHEAARFIAEELGADTPWHISRFFPNYELRGVPPTPPETLQRAQAAGRAAGLHHVYLGNVRTEANTVCHACAALLIRRLGFGVVENRVTAGGDCPQCGAPVAGVGMGGPQPGQRPGRAG